MGFRVAVFVVAGGCLVVASLASRTSRGREELRCDRGGVDRAGLPLVQSLRHQRPVHSGTTVEPAARLRPMRSARSSPKKKRRHPSASATDSKR